MSYQWNIKIKVNMPNTGCGDVKLLPLKDSSSLTKMNNKLTLQATNLQEIF
jgi:hypothetical protein